MQTAVTVDLEQVARLRAIASMMIEQGKQLVKELPLDEDGVMRMNRAISTLKEYVMYLDEVKVTGDVSQFNIRRGQLIDLITGMRVLH